MAVLLQVQSFKNDPDIQSIISKMSIFEPHKNAFIGAINPPAIHESISISKNSVLLSKIIVFMTFSVFL